MSIEIICPLYNGAKYIEELIRSINKQENVDIQKVLFILTDTNDDSEKILKKNGLCYCCFYHTRYCH